MKLEYRTLALTFFLLFSGCVGGSNTDISDPGLSAILESLRDYESQVKKIRRHQIESTMAHLTTDRHGNSSGQNDKYFVRTDGAYSIQEHELLSVNATGETVARYEFRMIQNPIYKAMLDVREDQFVLQSVSERLSQGIRSARFSNVLVSEILTLPIVEKWEFTKSSNHSVNVKAFFTQDTAINKKEYHSMNMDFELTKGFWLPISVEATYLDSYSTISLEKSYVWSEFENLPALVETVERRLDRSGSEHSSETRARLTKLQEPLDHSQCYLTYYGLPEPKGPEYDDGNKTWLIVSAVVFIIVFCLILRVFRSRRA